MLTVHIEMKGFVRMSFVTAWSSVCHLFALLVTPSIPVHRLVARIALNMFFFVREDAISVRVLNESCCNSIEFPLTRER